MKHDLLLLLVYCNISIYNGISTSSIKFMERCSLFRNLLPRVVRLSSKAIFEKDEKKIIVLILGENYKTIYTILRPDQLTVGLFGLRIMDTIHVEVLVRVGEIYTP